jgi:hypothetical protein
LDKLCRSCHRNKKGGIKQKFWFLSSNIMKPGKNIHHSVWQLLSPLFCFYGNCGKVCPTDSDFSGLSHSTRFGCCSYQVSSISVRAYDVSWSLLKSWKTQKMIIAGYLPNRNWWNLIGRTSTTSGTR